MVICDNCKLNDAGCTVKSLVLASGGSSCKFHAIQVMEKIAQTDDEYTISWPSGDRRITQTVKNGQILRQTIS